MTRIFGEVAALYDDIRPGYPAALATSLREYRAGEFGSVVDIGAGTGKGTAALLALNASITCVEPDDRMAALLTAKFPQVTVVNATFEEWTPPAGRVDLIACATAWHGMAAATHSAAEQRRTLTGLADTLARFGGTVTLDIRTLLTLARRPSAAR